MESTFAVCANFTHSSYYLLLSVTDSLTTQTINAFFPENMSFILQVRFDIFNILYEDTHKSEGEKMYESFKKVKS